VTLPLPASRLKPKPSGPIDGSDGQTLGGARVLVVDDDPEFLELATTVLRRAGAQVRTASAAARAHELVASWQPNVLLTDIAMPGEDGFMLANVARSIFTESGPHRSHLPIVAVSAYGTPEIRGRAAVAGFDGYLAKPVDPRALTQAIAKALHRET
jgi:CheY-like chemotaxis protein